RPAGHRTARHRRDARRAAGGSGSRARPRSAPSRGASGTARLGAARRTLALGRILALRRSRTAGAPSSFRAPTGSTAILLRAILVRLAAVVGDVEAGAFEEQAGAAGRHALAGLVAHRAVLGRVVLDAVEQLERVSVRAPVVVGRHPFLGS